jgi:hypothetical protein
MCLATLVVPVFLSGCSGINSTHSVSPASFFLPGLMKADPPPAPSPDAGDPVLLTDRQFAQAI